MSSVKQLAEKEAHKGYVRNVLTNDHFRFVSAAQNRRWWTYMVALSVMLIFVGLPLVSLSLFQFDPLQTVSISMLLRYSHFQIFLFISK